QTVRAQAGVWPVSFLGTDQLPPYNAGNAVPDQLNEPAPTCIHGPVQVRAVRLGTQVWMSMVLITFCASSRSALVLGYERITEMIRVPATSRIYRCQRLAGPCA